MRRRNGRGKLIAAAFAVAVALGVYVGQADKPTPAVTYYTVEDGETLWSIARPIADDRGEDIREAVARIMADNGIKADAVIRPGQKIVIK